MYTRAIKLLKEQQIARASELLVKCAKLGSCFDSSRNAKEILKELAEKSKEQA